MASASIPGMFPPVRLARGEWCVDGGVREILPLQVVLNQSEGAFGIVASPLTIPPAQMNNANLVDIATRCATDLVLGEIVANDARAVRTFSPHYVRDKVAGIAPEFLVHEVTEIDPGLIRINMAYGFMSAAIRLEGGRFGRQDYELVGSIIRQRMKIWRLENRVRFSTDDPLSSDDVWNALPASAKGDYLANRDTIRSPRGSQIANELQTEKSALSTLVAQCDPTLLPDDAVTWAQSRERHTWDNG